MKKCPSLCSAALLAALVLSSCSSLGSVNPGAQSADPSASPPQTSPTSTSQAELDYRAVFPQDQVNEITITISEENWQRMMDDMTALYGTGGSGDGERPGRQPGAANRPPGAEKDQPPREPGNQPPGNGLLGGSDEQNPIWVEAELRFQGQTWSHIGIRFKGNSSLKSTWSSGSLKLPFKLDFDQFEDQYPETEDQRFFGFKQLSFSSNFQDQSYLREKITADLFREAGVPAPQTAFYAVSLDYGQGIVYLGLYTAVEVVDDTLIQTQFKYDGGNVYKPEGPGASFAAGSFSEASFDKETNQEQDDYDDILALFDALHSEKRILDPETWRQNLEAVFDVDTFLNWLAVNTVIQNWDTYGVMNHNYYLYDDPDTGQLVWIPWDNNEALKSGGGRRSALPLDLSGVSEDWPLISYLRDDPAYYREYLGYLENFTGTVFLEDGMVQRYQSYHDLIAPFVEAEQSGGPQSGSGFHTSLAELNQHTHSRIAAVKSLLDP